MKTNILFKPIFLAFFIVTLLIYTITYIKNAAKLNSNNTLTVGMMSGWPPFMSINEQGKYEGIDVDVANALGKQLGKKVVIKEMGSLSTLFLSLERGAIDIILSGLDITQERQARMNLIPYCGEDITNMYLIFYRQIPQGVSSLEDLAKHANTTVCVEANSTSEKLIDLYPTIIKKQLKSISDIILDIRYSKSIAALAEPSVARNTFKKDPTLTYISVSLPKQLCIYGNGIAIKKENISLTNTIKEAILSLKTAGILDALEKKWNLKGK